MKKVKRYVLVGNDYSAFKKGFAYKGSFKPVDSDYTVTQLVGMYPSDWKEITVFDFQEGQKVICIDAIGYLVQGETYTVDAVGNAGITVEECDLPSGAASYKADRFIPATVNIELDWDEVLTLELLLDSEFQCSYIDTFRLQIREKLINKLK